MIHNPRLRPRPPPSEAPDAQHKTTLQIPSGVRATEAQIRSPLNP